MDVEEAYACGKRLEPLAAYDAPPIRLSVFEVKEIVKDWRTAQTDHGSVSYYGADKVRIRRAYWIGVLRTLRFVDRMHKTDIQILQDLMEAS
jgi:hypothetical protein